MNPGVAMTLSTKLTLIGDGAITTIGQSLSMTLDALLQAMRWRTNPLAHGLVALLE